MRNDVYVTHTCKNSKLKSTDPNYCDNAWIDIDRTHATTLPPTYLYCPECVKKGFKNPKTRQVTRTPEQIEKFKQRMKEYRDNKKRKQENDEN
jgi:hypothetical protein